MCVRLYNPIACRHTNTQQRIKQIIFWGIFSPPYFAIKLILFNLLLVTLASVQISQHFCFGARVIQKLRLDVTSYSHYKSQRGSTLRSTQITTFFDALALPFSSPSFSLSLLRSSFFLPFPCNDLPLFKKLHLDKDTAYGQHTCAHRQTHRCGPELHLRDGIMWADQGLGCSQSSLAGSFTKIIFTPK